MEEIKVNSITGTKNIENVLYLVRKSYYELVGAHTNQSYPETVIIDILVFSHCIVV